MRWNCPHCGSNLAVRDDKLSSAWSFSRCYKCGGFALVRRSDVNLIKVDRAPAGEPVLLPEANEDPTALLSKVATQNLARYTGAKASANAELAAAQAAAASIQISPAGASASSAKRPVIRTAIRRTLAGASPSTPASTLPQNNHSVPAPTSSHGFGLPEPLPEAPETSFAQRRLMPLAVAATGILAISSGIYLYLQGQALWEKAQAQNNAPAIEEPKNAAALPADANEIVQAPSMAPDATLIGRKPGGTAASADINHPVQPAAAVAATVEAPVQVSAPASNVIAAVSKTANRPDMIDEVHANAMAPDRSPPAQAQIKVELLTDSAHIHSGPGMKFPIVGTASNQRKYAVEEWRDRWFKINIENPAAKNAAQQPKTAWIRNDLVRLAP